MLQKQEQQGVWVRNRQALCVPTCGSRMTRGDVDPKAYEAVKTAILTFVNFQQSNDEETTKLIEPNPPKASLEWAYKNFQGQKV